MQTLRESLYCDVGYSDHTLGITVPIAAAAMGATVIEKHLTLDRTAVGPDHKASIEPEEFRVMVSAIRTVEAAMGDGIKRVLPCEEELRRAWREPAKADSAA
jgi:N,N'-diacetyllegionaminate synthase